MGQKKIIVKNLKKNFGDIEALKAISFDIEENEIYGFIGPDGAGKTTLFRILATLFKPDSGEVAVSGLSPVKDYKQLRALLGYMPGRFSLYQDLSVEENINFFASIFNTSLDENYELIKDIYSQIEPFKKRKAGALSGGMKQKLALSCALVHKPEILILDEPTTGVDAVSRMEFWEMLQKLREKDITMAVSTPYMDEASLCDRAALIQKGEILFIGKPGEIAGSFKKKLFAIKGGSHYELIRILRGYSGCHSAYPFGEFIHFAAKDSSESIAHIAEYLKNEGLKDVEIKEIGPGIEDAFMEMINE